MRIAFLHIPKTAGQSVHRSLVDLFPPAKICPARSNKALYGYSIGELSSYDLFSGHLDWSIVKLSGKFDFVFTVLRDPMDRILSFYFYLRKEALRRQKLGERIGEGMQAAIGLSPQEYFTGASPRIRRFLDNHYNNFYAYYLASGSYSGYSLLSEKFPPGSKELTDYALLGLSSLDRAYTLSNLGQLEKDVSSLAGVDLRQIAKFNVNESVLPSDRKRLLAEMSGDWDWEYDLSMLIESDHEIFHRFN